MVFKFLGRQFKRKFHLNNISYLPGSWIDDIYMQETKTVFGRIARELKIRIIYFTLFPVLGAFNLISNALTGIWYGIAAAFSKNGKDKVRYREISDKAFDIMVTNIFGLVFCVPIGLFYMREFSSMMVAPQRKSKLRTGGAFAELEAKIVYPRSSKEIAQLIKEAAQNNTKITIRGAGASQGLQYKPNGTGIVLDLKNSNQIFLNARDNTVTVGAGVTWDRLEEVLAPAGLAIQVRQASNIFSVGGSLSANVHGWSHKAGTIANTVTEIKIINAKGEMQTLTPADDLFGYVIGGFGQFGIIVKATLKVIPNENLQEKGVSIPIQEYVKYYQQDGTRNQLENPLHARTRMHLFRLSLEKGKLLKSGVSVQYVAEDPSAEPIRVSIYSEGSRGTRFQRIMTNIARKFDWVRTKYWNIESKRIISGNNQPMSTAEHMQAPIRAMLRNTRSDTEWLQEYFVPGANLASFLEKLGDLLDKNDVSLLNASVRPVKQDTITKNGYANNGDMFAVVLCFNQKLDDASRLKTRRWIKEATDLALANNGTYYLVYQPYATKEQFRKAYPQYQQVLAKKREVDPQNIFANGLGTYFEEEQFNPYNYVFTSDEHQQEFAGFLNNILMEVEPAKVNALLKDILSYADSSEEIFKEMHRRIGEATESFLSSKSRELRSLRTLKKDLAAQAKQLMDTDEQYTRDKPLNGILEVGYPGRHVPEMVPQLKITGNIDVMPETSAITDIIQSGFPRTHKRTFKLNYDNPTISAEPQSYDVVTCFVGLHHFNLQALDTFLRNLNRVMRNQGNFLLMDHDVTDNNSYAMAYLAHSVFNAVKGASIQEEMTEVRDFRSIDQWKAILTKYGFAMDPQPNPSLIREGDPSLNTMVRFRKIAELDAVAAGNSDAKVLLDVEGLRPFKPMLSNKQRASDTQELADSADVDPDNIRRLTKKNPLQFVDNSSEPKKPKSADGRPTLRG